MVIDAQEQEQPEGPSLGPVNFDLQAILNCVAFESNDFDSGNKTCPQA